MGTGSITLNGGIFQSGTGTTGTGLTDVGNMISRNIAIGVNGGAIDMQNAGGGGVPSLSVLTYTGTLSGSGPLSKTGSGTLNLVTNQSGYTGALTLAYNAGTVKLINNGTLNNAGSGGPSSISIFTGSTLALDSFNALNSQFAAVNNADRINDNTPIILAGGAINFDVATSGALREKVGTVTLAQGSSNAVAANAHTQGAELEITNLVHNTGGILVANAATGTLGTTGAAGRVFIDAIGGVATTNNQILPGWVTAAAVNFTAYNTTFGLGAIGTANFPAADAVNVVTAAAVAVTGGGQTVNTVNLTSAAAQNITFTGGTDVLTFAQGGLMFNNATTAATHSVGTAGIRGVLKSSTGELDIYLGSNAATTDTIESNIADGPNAGGTALVARRPGTLVINAPNNTYSGGSYFMTGITATAAAVGSLGTGGSVLVDNAQLNLNVSGTTTSTGGFTASEGGMIVLNSANTYNATGDRFTINAASVIEGFTSGTALTGLTRVSTLTAGGQIVLQPDAIIAHQVVPAGAAGVAANTIQGLGTTPNYYYGIGATFGTSTTTLQVGAGTPWKGISTDRSSRSFTQGTIIANSDFTLQGLNVAGTSATFTLGNAQNAATTSIINPTGGGKVNVYISGPFTLDSGTAAVGAGVGTANYSGVNNFILTPGSQIVLNQNNTLGGVAGTTAAGLIAQAGSTIDMSGTATVVGPMNGSVTLESGSRIVFNDNFSQLSGTGTITALTGSIFDITGALGISGTQTVNVSPGVIARAGVDSITSLVSRFGSSSIYELAGGTNTLVASPASPASVLTLSATSGVGGVITNDSSARTLAATANGYITIGSGGGTFAATTGANLTVAEDFDLTTNTLNIGSAGSTDGLLKAGSVLVSAAGNRGTLGSIINVLSGATFEPTVANVVPDSTRVNLNTGAIYDLNNVADVIGSLSGGGTIISNNGSPTLTVGADGTSTTFSGLITTNNPALLKIGTGTLSLTSAPYLHRQPDRQWRHRKAIEQRRRGWDDLIGYRHRQCRWRPHPRQSHCFDQRQYQQPPGREGPDSSGWHVQLLRLGRGRD